MKKIITIALISALFISCETGTKEKTVVISGTIENVDLDSVYIFNEGFRKSIAFENGKFKDTLTISQSAYFTFSAGRERTQLFLKPGDNLTISTDMEEFDEKLTYSGSAANENNFLAQKQLKEEALIYLDPNAFFSVEAPIFKSKLQELKSSQLDELKNIKVSKNFMEFEMKNIEFQYYMLMAQYPVAHNYFTQNTIEMPADFEEEMSHLDIDNEADFDAIPLYRSYVIYNYSQEIEKANSPKKTLSIISEIQSQKIKNAVMKNALLYNISTGAEGAKDFHDFIQKNATDEDLKEESTKAFNSVQNVLPGKDSPKFNYPDINGKQVSLDDLKGNLVYIDVWATWCAPCLAEIPHLKKLDSNYKSQAIKFVSISVDPKSDFDKWKNMVKDKELQGIQLFSDKDWGSQFVLDYGIKGIPRFILLDKEGKIITANAPRPSDSQIRSLIDANL